MELKYIYLWIAIYFFLYKSTFKKKGSNKMKNTYKYLFGPVPSRRMGISLGVSPIPERTCSYSCVYCQLGRTKHMQSERKLFFPVQDILDEFIHYQKSLPKLDVVSIVGEGEPTLYSGLGELITELKKVTTVPVAVITNGSLLTRPEVQEALLHADIVLPSMDACNEKAFRQINRPHFSVKYEEVQKGLIEFSQTYGGQLWLEIMFVAGINDNSASLDEFAAMLPKIKYDRVYINTPVRPPAEAFVKAPSKEFIHEAVTRLSAISIDMLSSGSFYSDVTDNYEAVKSICKRHPMNSFELEAFLTSRNVSDIDTYKNRIKNDPLFDCIDYKGIITYRLK